MSSIVNRIATVFTASGGNVRAVMGQVQGGMMGIHQAATQTQRSTGALNNQLRALGTTIRYAIAGTAVFGVTSLVRQLSQMQTQMSLMQSIADVTGDMGQKVELSGHRLHGIFDELQRGSVDALTPVNELGAATINLLSSVQGIPDDEIARIPIAMAKGAQLAQVSAEDLTKAVTGMNQAFGRTPNQGNFEDLIRGFVTLTRRAPGGVSAGSAIINQLAPLAAVSRLARVSPQQMFGLLTTSLRFGGTPATGARGLQFLLQSIAAPNKSEAKELAAVGITPDFVQRVGGVAAIRKLIAAASAKGISGAGNLKNLSDEQLDMLDTAGMEGLAQLGVSGQGVEFLQRSIGRIHGVRALVTLMSQMPTGNFAADIVAADNAVKGIHKEGTDLADQFRKFREGQPLRALSIALQSVALEAPRALEGLLNPLARQLGRVGEFALDHPKGTRHVMQGAAAFMSALAIARLTGRARGGLLGRLTGRNAFVMGNAAQAAVDPTRHGILGGSPQNPMFVTVVGTIFGPGSGGGPGVPGGPGGTPPIIATGGRGAGRGGRLTRIGGKAARVAGPIGLGILGLEMIDEFSEHDPEKQRNARARVVSQHRQAQKRIADQVNQAYLMRLRSRAEDRNPEIERLNRILRPFHRRDPLYGVSRIFSQRQQMIHGKAEMVLDVNLITAQGVKRKRIHVPMDLYAGGRTPSQRGKPGKTKANAP